MDETTPPTPAPEPQQVVSQPQPVVVPAVPIDPAKDVADNKDIAAISYLWILSIFVYIYKRESPFIRFHAKQGIVLFAATIVSAMVPTILARLIQLLVVIGCIAGFAFAAQGKWKKLPLVYAVSTGDVKALRTSWKESLDAMMAWWKKTKTAHTAETPPSNPTPPNPQ